MEAIKTFMNRYDKPCQVEYNNGEHIVFFATLREALRHSPPSWVYTSRIVL